MAAKKAKAAPKRMVMEIPPLVREKYGERFNYTDDVPDELRMSGRMIELIQGVDTMLGGIEMENTLQVDCAAIAWNETVREDFGSGCSPLLTNALVDFTKLRNLIDEFKLGKRLLFPADFRIVQGAFASTDENGNRKIFVIADYNFAAVEGILDMTDQEALGAIIKGDAALAASTDKISGAKLDAANKRKTALFERAEKVVKAVPESYDDEYYNEDEHWDGDEDEYGDET